MEPTLGQIFTFYSYKGGTGRSMALANVACVLADKWADDEKILMIDWDLEAPGLHSFFDRHLKKTNSFELDKQLGLIDLFIKFKESCAKLSPSDEIPNSFFEDVNINKYILETDINNLFLMTAGLFDDLYPTKVNTFNWEDLFNQSPRLIPSFANYLAKNFKYVLIDSRTGFTDISSVCTSLMPERLIVVFTPNRQSLTGVLGLVEHVTTYRKKSDDLRPLVVFPLPSRIENAELELQKDWRYGSKKNKVDGYQPQFESILNQVYDFPEGNLTDYFNDIQIQYVPRYSYGEEIAVLLDRSEDRLSISRSYENFAEAIVSIDAPWEYKSKSTIIASGNVTDSKIFISGSYSDSTILGNDNTVNINYLINSGPKLRVFLSHASSDKPIVRDLYQRLALENWIDPWLDEEKLLPGQEWDMEIRKAVESAHAVIICLSSKSVSKEGYIQKELQISLEAALERPEGKVFILPLRLDDCEVPRRIQLWQYADYFPKERREKTYMKLLQSLRIRQESLK
ncbi:MAG: TIR domain-containing protein [Chloroflexota bacterium]